jgi:hypothetical protein
MKDLGDEDRLVYELGHSAAFVPRSQRKLAEILRLTRNSCAIGCKEV